MSNKKYDYDIKKIEDMQNEASKNGKNISIRDIARKNDWEEVATHNWIRRNYYKIVKYVKRKK